MASLPALRIIPDISIPPALVPHLPHFAALTSLGVMDLDASQEAQEFQIQTFFDVLAPGLSKLGRWGAWAQDAPRKPPGKQGNPRLTDGPGGGLAHCETPAKKV